MTSLQGCAHARMCALSRYMRGCVHYPDAREDVCTIRYTRECSHYPDAREDVRIIRSTRGCAHGGIRKNTFLERCIDKMKILRYLKYKYTYIGLDTVCFRY